MIAEWFNLNGGQRLVIAIIFLVATVWALAEWWRATVRRRGSKGRRW